MWANAAPSYRQQIDEMRREAFRFDRSDNAEMWLDYRFFKAAGLLELWRKKWVSNIAPRFMPRQRPAATP